jgi:hypothetical protein
MYNDHHVICNKWATIEQYEEMKREEVVTKYTVTVLIQYNTERRCVAGRI